LRVSPPLVRGHGGRVSSLLASLKHRLVRRQHRGFGGGGGVRAVLPRRMRRGRNAHRVADACPDLAAAVAPYEGVYEIVRLRQPGGDAFDTAMS
jgi:hypothetical protein